MKAFAYFLARLQESGSWAGIAAVLAAAGVSLPPGVWKSAVLLGMIGAAAASVLIKEGIRQALVSGDLSGAIEGAAMNAAKALAIVLMFGVMGFGLSACSATAQTSVVAGLETTYIGAVDAELAYAATPGASAATIAKFGTYRTAAYNALQPLMDAADCAATIQTVATPCVSVASTAENETAEAAISALTNYITTAGIKPATTGSTAS